MKLILERIRPTYAYYFHMKSLYNSTLQLIIKIPSWGSFKSYFDHFFFLAACQCAHQLMVGISIIFLYCLPKPHWSSERSWVVFLTPFDTAMPPCGNSHFLLFYSYINILLWSPIKVPFPAWDNFPEDSLRNTLWLFCSDPRQVVSFEKSSPSTSPLYRWY